MKASELQTNEYASYYSHYINASGNQDLLVGLSESGKSLERLLVATPEGKWQYAYEEGKWTIKELVHHIIDAERVFAYRALRFGRNDKTDLPGFEQDDYVVAAHANKRTKESLLNEYKSVRQATLALFESFSNEDLIRIGTASGNPMSVRALGFVIIGHETHHANILKERYL